jgi:arginyl-tRNA--protein-N-Asp/Glu arginylyltransferase
LDLERINLALRDYDSTYFENLDLVLRNISHKSKALASNLKDCIIRLKNSDRYLRAYRQEKIAVKDSELEDEEFEIFRKYVRLLRSCTIMCGHESSNEYKKLFIDFFSGTRLKLAQELRHKDGTC